MLLVEEISFLTPAEFAVHFEILAFTILLLSLIYHAKLQIRVAIKLSIPC